MADAKEGVKVKYVGPADVRKIGKADFTRVSADSEAAVWDVSNNWVAEVSPAAAEFLLKNSPDEFKEFKPA